MNYTALLLQIENQLLSLNKKGLNYINIGALPDVELKRVIDGLEEMFSSENTISQETRETKNQPSEMAEKFEETINNTDFFNNFPFKSNVKKILLDSKTHPGNRWAAYSLIKTYENMKKIEEKNFENK